MGSQKHGAGGAADKTLSFDDNLLDLVAAYHYGIGGAHCWPITQPNEKRVCGRWPSGTGLGMIVISAMILSSLCGVRNVFCLPCVVSEMSSVFLVWCPKCLVFLVWRPECLVSSLCGVRNVLCLPCVVSGMSCVFLVWCPKCLLSSLCGVRNVFCLPCVVSEMSSVFPM